MITDHDIYGMISEIATARERWMAFWMKQILPPVLMRWVDERKNLKAVSDYMERHRIRTVIRVGSTTETLMHGDKLIATFEVRTTRR